MNARALLLILAVLALGGGLAYFLTSEAPRPSSDDGPLVSGLGQAPRATAPEDVPSQRGTLERAQLVGLSGAWTIIVVGPRGESLNDARITARLGDTTETAKTAKGRATLTGLEPGTWQLTVSHEGLPTWDAAVAVEGGGKETRTPVKLTNQIRVAGNVLDERGEPVGGVTLWLLRENESHPTDAQLAKGLIQHTSTTDGRFQLDTEEPGRWKLSVGRAGQKPRFESAVFELEHGPERRAKVVVPARARLVVDVPSDDYKGPNILTVLAQREGPPPNVETTKSSDGDTTHTEDGSQTSPSELEAVRRKRAALGDAGAEGGDGDEAFAKAQSLEQLSGEQRQRMQEAEQRMERERQRRARLIEEGWTNVRSVRFERGMPGEIAELPEEKSLRFVLYRGSEGFQVAETLVAPRGASVRLTLTPPPPFAPGAELPDFPRLAPSRMEVTLIGPKSLPLGLTFEG
jgi:hypothetical protein